MTATELLKPRFEVINTFPYNERFPVGRIIKFPYFDEIDEVWTLSSESSLDHTYFDQYPHLFKKLQWWEHRDISDMPKKVQSLSFPSDGPYNIEKWDMDILFGFIDVKKRKGCDLTAMKPEYGYIPVD